MANRVENCVKQVSIGQRDIHDLSSNCVKDCVKEITNRQHQILMAIQAEPSISAQKLSKSGIASIRAVQSELANLQKKGLLVRKDGRKDGFRELTDAVKSIIHPQE